MGVERTGVELAATADPATMDPTAMASRTGGSEGVWSRIAAGEKCSRA